MKKCLKITLVSKTLDNDIRNFIQKAARKLDLEGTVQLVQSNEFVVIACGLKSNIDNFLDIIHEGFGDYTPDMVHVEPFLKERDYRGMFRILE
ncbi:MAG TPA: hypothetical protein VLB80_04275 [Candidatus Babeliales bacterium]|nr:hypothetical protein [Candidatus Babeliales bacterium]